MKRYIRSSSNLLEEFMRYHEDSQNYDKNRRGFDAVYEILDKYGSENENVDKIFMRATPEDQKKMVDLIRPKERSSSVTSSSLRQKFIQLQNKWDRNTISSYEDGYFNAMCDMAEAFGIDLQH